MAICPLIMRSSMQPTIRASKGGRVRETFRVFAVNRCFGVLWSCSGPFQCSERAKMRDECSHNILFSTRILKIAPSWQADMMPACHDRPGIEPRPQNAAPSLPSSPLSNNFLKCNKLRAGVRPPRATSLLAGLPRGAVKGCVLRYSRDHGVVFS